jgi:hypothetical protein
MMLQQQREEAKGSVVQLNQRWNLLTVQVKKAPFE